MNLFSNITSSYKDPFTDPFSQFKSTVTPQTTVTNTGAGTSLNSSVQSSYKLPKGIPTPVLEPTMARSIGDNTDKFGQNQSNDFMAQDFAGSLFKGIADTANKTKGAFSEGVSNASNFVGYRALGQKVQEKYPGAYDNVDLALLGKKMLEKYPVYQKFVDEQNNTSFMEHPMASTIGAVGKGLTLGGETASTGVEQAATAPQQKDFATASSQFGKGIMNTALGGTQLATSFNPAGLTLNTAFSTDTAGNVLRPVNDIMGQGIYNIQSGLGFDPNSEASKNVREMGQTTATLGALKLAHTGVNKAVETATPYVKPLVNNAVEGTVNIVKKIPTPTLPKASELLVNQLEKTNRMNPTKYIEFEKMAGERAGKFMADRGITGGAEENVARLYDNFQKSKAEADTGLDAIKKTYKSSELPPQFNKIVSDLDKRLTYTEDSNLPFIKEIKNKAENGTLTQTDINAVKRMYEQKVKVNYIKDQNSLEVDRATNLDNGLRTWQFDEASKLGFDNLKQINKETQLNRYLADNIGDKIARQAGLNNISLTDWIIAGQVPGTPQALALLAGKKLAQNVVPKIYQKSLEKIAKIPKKEAPVANVKNISKMETIRQNITPKYDSNRLLVSPRNSSRSPATVIPEVTLPKGEKGKQTIKTPVVKSDITNKSIIKRPTNESKVIKPVSSDTIPEGYKKNVFGEIVKKPSIKKGGFIKIPEIGKKSPDSGLIEETRNIPKMNKGQEDLFKKDYGDFIDLELELKKAIKQGIPKKEVIKKIKYIERAVSEDEYKSIIKNGYIQSNSNKNFSNQLGDTYYHTEGKGTSFYLPENGGYIVKIKVKPEHNIDINEVGEVFTNKKIPISDIVEIQGGKGIVKTK